MKYFIANWKANKNLDESEAYLDLLTQNLSQNQPVLNKLNGGELKIILAPPVLFLPQLKLKMKDIKKIELAAQDISQFEEGAYTGEVTAKTLAGLVNYAIIGHSERREYFKEGEDILFKKAELAKKYEINPIFCIRSSEDKFPPQINLLAYEPVSAIGTGNNENPNEVLKIKDQLNLNPTIAFIYGGSVSKENAKSYLQTGKIDGFLIGQASLDPLQFIGIINNSLS